MFISEYKKRVIEGDLKDLNTRCNELQIRYNLLLDYLEVEYEQVEKKCRTMFDEGKCKVSSYRKIKGRNNKK